VETSTPLTHAERGAMGARVANASMTAAERHERARKAHLAGAVNAVVARAPELSDAQRAKLQALFAPAEVA
jgi:hypothetical protein